MMDDLISRQAAIKAVEKSMYENPHENDIHRGMHDHEHRHFLTILMGLPPAQPEPHWIPCSERLPDNGRQVLVFARSVHFALAKYDEMREADGTYKMQWVTFDAWKPFYKIKDVIAWMPLPEPARLEND